MEDSASRVMEAIRGAGSLLDIASSTPFEGLVPAVSFNESLRANFSRVGGAMRQAMNTERMTNEPASKEEKASPKED